MARKRKLDEKVLYSPTSSVWRAEKVNFTLVGWLSPSMIVPIFRTVGCTTYRPVRLLLKPGESLPVLSRRVVGTEKDAWLSGWPRSVFLPALREG